MLSVPYELLPRFCRDPAAERAINCLCTALKNKVPRLFSFDTDDTLPAEDSCGRARKPKPARFGIIGRSDFYTCSFYTKHSSAAELTYKILRDDDTIISTNNVPFWLFYAPARVYKLYKVYTPRKNKSCRGNSYVRAGRMDISDDYLLSTPNIMLEYGVVSDLYFTYKSKAEALALSAGHARVYKKMTRDSV